jgi:hypothetical protein
MVIEKLTENKTKTHKQSPQKALEIRIRKLSDEVVERMAEVAALEVEHRRQQMHRIGDVVQLVVTCSRLQHALTALRNEGAVSCR